MKIILTLVCLVFVTGCARLSQPTTEAKARAFEEGKRAHEKSLAIEARARDYEKRGLSSREARAAAEIEYAKSGAR